ncbi:carbon-nitrogen hydrolase family protein [Saccharopolyspora spinosa]|uniref:Amidohydrolase n=1 Tax=Saccharopolyspora spinosa TaxID=60894 RepID=A0A2N3Y6U5_SACSN|nr:carbon-nitrogen hydrolase family protein [Saccharopolyspora spinosa]PKW18585.1 putative amidohydrolase [Saccharopolyspora spinosa]
MQDVVRVSAVQFSSSWLEPDKNAKRMAQFVADEAATFDADLVVFPELASTGYIEPYTDESFAAQLYGVAETTDGPTVETLSRVARDRSCHIIAGLCLKHPVIPYLLYNASVLIDAGGEVVGVHNKVHGAFDEKNYFVRGNSIDVYETKLGRIGMNICYDVRFPEVARVQALKGAELIVSCWSSFRQPDKQPANNIEMRTAVRAMENQLYFVSCNRSGQEGRRLYYGGSAIAGPGGDILARCTGEGEEVVRAELNNKELLAQRAYLPVLRDRRPELYSAVVEPM